MHVRGNALRLSWRILDGVRVFSVLISVQTGSGASVLLATLHFGGNEGKAELVWGGGVEVEIESSKETEIFVFTGE